MLLGQRLGHLLTIPIPTDGAIPSRRPSPTLSGRCLPSACRQAAARWLQERAERGGVGQSAESKRLNGKDARYGERRSDDESGDLHRLGVPVLGRLGSAFGSRVRSQEQIALCRTGADGVLVVNCMV